jgi:hypothetical protein
VKKWPWWAWLAIGVVGGVAATAALLEGTRIDHAAIWSADVAMSGWVGALLGAFLTGFVAWLVLSLTLRADRSSARRDRRMAAAEALLETLAESNMVTNRSELRLFEDRVLTRVQIWRMHADDRASDDFARDIGRLAATLMTVRKRASAADAEKWESERGSFLAELVLHVTQWHTEYGDQRDASAAWAAGKARALSAGEIEWLKVADK